MQCNAGNPPDCSASNPNAGQPAWQGNETYLLLANNWGHPGESADAIRRWQATQTGTISISTNGNTISDGDSSYGDGVLVYIKKNGAALWQGSVANGGSITVPSSDPALNNVAVVNGDRIDFWINKGSGNNWCDKTAHSVIS